MMSSRVLDTQGRMKIQALTDRASPWIVGNQLVNPGFEIWQRGAGPFAPATGTSLYCADRWDVYELSTDSIQADREGTTKRTDSAYSIKISYTAGAQGSFLRQRLVMSDGYYYLRGQTIYASIWLKCTAAQYDSVQIRLTVDGTGGTTIAGYNQYTTDWHQIQVGPLVVPTNATYIDLWPSFWASDTFYLDNACLAISSRAIDYIPLMPHEEWARCLRYYEVTGGGTSLGPTGHYAAAHAAGYSMGTGMPFVTRKSITPTMTKSGTWAVVNCGQPATIYAGPGGYLLYASSSATGASSFLTNSSDDTVTAEANPS